MSFIEVELYLVRHGLPCSTIIEKFYEKSGNNLVKNGVSEIKSIVSDDSLLCNLGIYECELINQNNNIQNILLKQSDLICSSNLSRAIESSLIMFQKAREIFIIPYVSEISKPIIKIKTTLYEKFFGKKKENNKNNKNNENNIFEEKKYHLKMDKNNSLFEENYLILKSKYKNSKNLYDLLNLKKNNGIIKTKTPKVNWDIFDKFILLKKPLKQNKNKFFKDIIPELIKKVDENKGKHSDKYIFTILTHKSFIDKIIKKYLENNRVKYNIEPTSIFKIKFYYNVLDYKETILSVDKVYPVYEFHDNLELIDNKYYLEYGLHRKRFLPLDDEELLESEINTDIYSKCPKANLIEKELLKYREKKYKKYV